MLPGALRKPTRQGILATPDSTYEWRRKGEQVTSQPGARYQTSVTWIPGVNQPGALTNRSSFRRSTLRGTWESAAPGPSGGRLCAVCNEVEVLVPPLAGQRRDWDMGHFPSWTNRMFVVGVTRGQVIENYQAGTRVECPGCNRSRGNNDGR